jgi:hypothetical protein
LFIGLKKNSKDWSNLSTLEIEFVVKNDSEFAIENLDLIFPFDPRLNKDFSSLAVG